MIDINFRIFVYYKCYYLFIFIKIVSILKKLECPQNKYLWNSMRLLKGGPLDRLKLQDYTTSKPKNLMLEWNQELAIISRQKKNFQKYIWTYYNYNKNLLTLKKRWRTLIKMLKISNKFKYKQMWDNNQAIETLNKRMISKIKLTLWKEM